MLSIERHRHPVQCPRCGHQFTQTIGRLKNATSLTCPACKEGFAVDAKALKKGLDSVGRAMGDLNKALQKLGKL